MSSENLALKIDCSWFLFFHFINVLFCTTDSKNLLDLEWQVGI